MSDSCVSMDIFRMSPFEILHRLEKRCRDMSIDCQTVSSQTHGKISELVCMYKSSCYMRDFQVDDELVANAEAAVIEFNFLFSG